MPISSLPDSTVRALTSTLVLSDAASVIKELVDNALDAGATAIAVEISANALDVIQVKDNGTGIGIEDRQLICKKGCTSKIASIEDLEHLGGATLGFRGEALGSIADLSESVTLTTRVDGETAGSMLVYGTTGALLSCSSASHPVGSTFKIKKFLESVPVRKQAALKNPSKSLVAIKKLLQSYAFARGTVRFMFRVLKAKNDKANWSFSPADRVENLANVAVRILGKEIGGQYYVKKLQTPDSCESISKDDKYSITALLIDTNEEPANDQTSGHHISVDGRPMTASRGTTKEIVKLYRQYVRNSVVNLRKSSTSSDPLLVMHITCPPGSYDVNIEPTKDEVMFINPELLLRTVEALYKQCYGELLGPAEISATSQKMLTTSSQASSCNLLLARKPEPHPIVTEICPSARPLPLTIGQNFSPIHDTCVSSAEFTSRHNSSADPLKQVHVESETSNTAPKILSTMYGFDEEEHQSMSLAPQSPNLEEATSSETLDISRNPWSLAKLRIPVQASSNLSEVISPTWELSADTTFPSSQAGDLQATPQPGTHREPLKFQPQLPSPLTSPQSPDGYQNPGPPNRPWVPRERDVSVRAPKSTISARSPSTIECGQMRNSQTTLGKRNTRPTQLPSLRKTSDVSEGGTSPSNSASQDQAVLTGSLFSLVSCTQPMQKFSLHRPGESSTLNTLDRKALDNEDIAQSGALSDTIGPLLSKTWGSQSSELAQIMNFEHLKRTVNQQQRKALSRPGGNMSISRLAELQHSTGKGRRDVRDLMNATSNQSCAEDLDDGSQPSSSLCERFGGLGSVKSSFQKSHPHKNRYLAATRHLATISMDRVDSDGSDKTATQSTGPATLMNIGVGDCIMADQDPRSYLIKHRTESETANSNGLTRTGLKIRRTKTHKLPLESIPIGVTLHELASNVDIDLQDLASDRLNCDKYYTAGKNAFIVWAPTSSDVAAWQTELSRLINKMYRGRFGDEIVPPNLNLDVKRMIKIHCDEI